MSNYGSKKNCKIIICNCDFNDIFETFKTIVINSGFLYLKKKKIHVDVYVDTKYYFDKYFKIGNIFTIFFTNRLFRY